MSTRFLSFHDFAIEKSAEVGVCGNMGSFRAVRRTDRLPVLLHRFRPAADILGKNPIIRCAQPPDFARPFITRFIGLIKAAGSAYLVEPLPISSPVEAVWRLLLCEAPAEAAGFIEVVLQHALSVKGQLGSDTSRCVIHLSHLVLANNGMIGVLQTRLESEQGPIWVREVTQNLYAAPSHIVLAAILADLLRVETTMAAARGCGLLPDAGRRRLLKLAESIGQGRSQHRCLGSS